MSEVYEFGAWTIGTILGAAWMGGVFHLLAIKTSAFVNDEKAVPPPYLKCDEDWENAYFVYGVGLIAAMVFALSWPAGVPASLFLVLLHAMRYAIRTKKKLGQLWNAAHLHPDTVETKPLEQEETGNE